MPKQKQQKSSPSEGQFARPDVLNQISVDQESSLLEELVHLHVLGIRYKSDMGYIVRRLRYKVYDA